MGRLIRFFNEIIRRRQLARQPRPRNSPENLDMDTLEKVLKEARFLRLHDVNVQALNPGEFPGLPKRADKD